jgi:hypothetical protein
MLTANLLAVVADLLTELGLEARDVSELVALPDVVAAMHITRDDDGAIVCDEELSLAVLESTTWDNAGRVSAIVRHLVWELGLNSDVVTSVRISAVDGITAEVSWPQPIRIDL